MKYLVDTCGWIEWLLNSSLAENFERYLKHPDNLVVPTIIQFELYKWICREKNEETALEIIGITEQSQVIPLSTTIALTAAELANKYQLAMADAIIYATAQQNQATIITSDQHFKDLPQIIFVQKNHAKKTT